MSLTKSQEISAKNTQMNSIPNYSQFLRIFHTKTTLEREWIVVVVVVVAVGGLVNVFVVVTLVVVLVVVVEAAVVIVIVS
jgi:hypothetical protein